MATSIINVSQEGLLHAVDLETALRELLNRFATTQPMHVEGKDALKYDVTRDAIKLHRFRARTSRGERVELDGAVLPLPVSEPAAATAPESLLRVGIEWTRAPVRDGSVIALARPRLRLLAAGETAEGGELTLGEWGQGGFKALPVPSTRLDGDKASREWFERLQSTLRASFQRLAVISTRLAETNCPVLLWNALLGGAYAGLGLALELDLSDAPMEAERRLRGWLRSLAALPKRAAQTGDGDVVRLLEQIAWRELTPPAPSSHAGALHDLEHNTKLAFDYLEQLARQLGTGLVELPAHVYHTGRTFRRLHAAEFSVCRESGGEVVWRLDTPAPNHPVGLAVLWEGPNDRVAFGEVRFHNNVAGRRSNELYLGAIGVDTFHWIGPETSSIHGGCIVAPASMTLRRAALYAPELDG